MYKTIKRPIQVLVLAALVFSVSSCALMQGGTPLTRSADKFFLQGNYRAAANLYEEMLRANPKDAQALYRAGISYMSFDKEKAADYLYRAYELDPAVDGEILYWLGRTEHINYQFDQAIAHLQTYHDGLSKLNTQRIEETQQLIQQAKNAKEAVANPQDIFVENLGNVVNSMYSEHSPVISSDDNYLLFTTRSKKVTGGLEAVDGEYFEDIFETTRTETGAWGAVKAVSGALNSAGHDASIQLFDKDSKMLIYRSANDGDLFVSERQPDGSWGAPKTISKKINSRFYESDAFITPDGNTLYFATDQFNKGNNLDIYKVQRQENGDWGDPETVGGNINTPFDEDSPFLVGEGTLYFASRGHNTIGGYDIFVSKYDSTANQWGKPENLGVPVNSPDDDTYYRLSHDGRYAYLSSYRIGGYGEKDIYTINYIRPARIAGGVYSRQDSMAIAGLEVRFSGMQANNQPITFKAVTNPETGKYELTPLSGRKYTVEIIQDGKVIASEPYEVPMVVNETSPYTKNFYIDLKSNTRAKGNKVVQGSGR